MIGLHFQLAMLREHLFLSLDQPWKLYFKLLHLDIQVRPTTWGLQELVESEVSY